MKNVDDGPDGLNDAAFDRALGLKRKKRARRPKATPLTRFVARLVAAIRALEEEVRIPDTQDLIFPHDWRIDGGGRWVADCTQPHPWLTIRSIQQSEDAAELMAGIREACRAR